MQIVIEIDEEDFQRCKKRLKMRIDTMGNAIANGVPLSKGHGRIGDLDKLKANIEEYRDTYDRNGDDYEFGKYTAYDMSIDAIDSAPTIIDADRSETDHAST